jgi:hypothetical protein
MGSEDTPANRGGPGASNEPEAMQRATAGEAGKEERR